MLSIIYIILLPRSFSFALYYVLVLLPLFSCSFILLLSCSPPPSLISLFSYSSSLAFSNIFPTLFALLFFLLFYGYLFKKKKSKAFQHVHVLQRFVFLCRLLWDLLRELRIVVFWHSRRFAHVLHVQAIWCKTKKLPEIKIKNISAGLAKEGGGGG